MLCFNTVYLTASQTLSCSNFKSEFFSKFKTSIQSYYQHLELIDLEIHDVNQKAKVNNCDYVQFDLSKQTNLKKNIVIKFDAYNKENEFLRRITKVFSLTGKAKILRTTNRSYVGDHVKAAGIFTDEVSIDQISVYMVSQVNQDKDYEFKSFTDRNQVLETWMIREIPDFRKGDLVKALYKKGNITLTLDANIMENGNIGDEIKLQLKKNQKMVVGKAYDKKTIIIAGR